jgi:hypothetical protein
MCDRPMHRWKWYSVVTQENSGTIYVEVKFHIRWNSKNTWDRLMHCGKWYSVVTEEDSGTIFTELKFLIR